MSKRICRHEPARAIRVGGEVAQVTATGSGPPVVLLASMLIWRHIYRPTIRALEKRFRVIVIELPGSASGSRLRVPWTFERYASWLSELLEALALERITLIGHSMSGAVALLAGAVHPERIARLVLVDSVGINPPVSLVWLLCARVADIPLEPEFTLRATPAIFYNSVVHTRNAWNQLRLAATADLSRYAALVRVPTLLAWGARDHTVPLESARALQRLMPDATLYVSPEGSHDWLIVRPAELASVLSGYAA